MSLFSYLKKRKEQPHGIVKVYSGHVVAKFLLGADLDGYMHGSTTDRPDCCPICHNRIKDVIDMGVSFKMGKVDLSYTWDHYCIVSEKFKDFCLKREYPNLEIIPLPNCKNLYYFQPHSIFRLDHERWGTKFYNSRKCCGEYDEVISPSQIKAADFNLSSNDFIMRTEFKYASYQYKCPCIVIGTDTAKEMKNYGLKGIYFKDIYDLRGLKITEKVVNAIVLE